MKISGFVTDGTTGEPVVDARVTLRVDGKQFVSSSDTSGRYEWRTDSSYVGGSLKIRVEKDGFEPTEEKGAIDREDMRVDLTLVPVEQPRPRDLDFRVRDQAGAPVPDAELRLRADREMLGAWRSGADGSVRAMVPDGFEGRPLTYSVKAAGFQPVDGSVHPSELPVAGVDVTLEALGEVAWWRRVLGTVHWRVVVPYAVVLVLTLMWLADATGSARGIGTYHAAVLMPQAVLLGFLFYTIAGRLESGKLATLGALFVVSLPAVADLWPSLPAGIFLAGLGVFVAGRASGWLSGIQGRLGGGGK